MLTAKGKFVVELINQGINLPLKDYDALWLNAQDGRVAAVSSTGRCPTCGQIT